MTKILWLTPNTAENVSVGRKRIANGLSGRGYTVSLQQATPKAVLSTSDGYDAVIGTTRLGGLVGWLQSVNPLSDTPFVVDHVDPIRQFYTTDNRVVASGVDWGERMAFRQADAVLYVYDEERNRVESRARLTRKTHLGVDVEKFSSEAKCQSDRVARELNERGIDGDYSVYIGAVTPYYNVDTMIDAAYHTETDIVVCGDGPLRGRVETAARQLENIHYIDGIPHDDVPALLNRASAGICLVDDPHTVKVLEYGAAGLPVVHIRGRAEREYSSGVHFTKNKPAMVANTIDYARSKDSGPTDYAMNHSWESAVNDYDSVLREVVA